MLGTTLGAVPIYSNTIPHFAPEVKSKMAHDAIILSSEIVVLVPTNLGRPWQDRW